MSLLHITASRGGESGGTPALAWSAPSGLSDGNEMIISTDGTYDFTTKTNAKPLIWWSADEGGVDGDTPSTLGRKTTWDSTFQGTKSSVITAVNSDNSVMWNFGLSTSSAGEDPALGFVDYTSDYMYLWRKNYDDFVIEEDHIARTALSNYTNFNIGDTVTGVTSGVTGTIERFYTGSKQQIAWTKGDGGHDYTTTDFTIGETATSSSGGSATVEDTQGSGFSVFRTFNHKIYRNRNTASPENNNFVSCQAFDNGNTFGNDKYDMTFENSTENTVEFPSWTNQLADLSKQWRVEELEHLTSSAGSADGKENFYQNTVIGPPLANSYQSVDAGDARYNRIVQAQVSNGAAPSAKLYMDCLYIDDTWHRVIISDSSTWDNTTASTEIQIPSAWSTSEITVTIRQGSFASLSGKYLYVFDDSGVTPVNTNGIAL